MTVKPKYVVLKKRLLAAPDGDQTSEYLETETILRLGGDPPADKRTVWANRCSESTKFVVAEADLRDATEDLTTDATEEQWCTSGDAEEASGFL